MKKTIFIITVLFLMTVVGLYIYGYRLTPEGAAQANISIGEAQLITKTKTSVGEVFVYKKDNYFITTASQKRAFMWISKNSFNTKDVDDKNDPVCLIGWISISSKAQCGTVMIVQSHDDRVAYIEAGTAINKKREYSDKDGIFIFNWTQAYNPLQNNEPEAYSYKGNKLHIYCYKRQSSNDIDIKGLRWYAMFEGNSD